ncbi:MAG: hypothetical protein MUO76_07165 [Anaerolineaceae bacterium]|nr:hypothetical protein [Anaerolineaceae bacterium]
MDEKTQEILENKFFQYYQTQIEILESLTLQDLFIKTNHFLLPISSENRQIHKIISTLVNEKLDSVSSRNILSMIRQIVLELLDSEIDIGERIRFLSQKNDENYQKINWNKVLLYHNQINKK